MSNGEMVKFFNESGNRIWLRILKDDSFSNFVLEANGELEEKMKLDYDRYCYSKSGPLGNDCDEIIVRKTKIELK